MSTTTRISLTTRLVEPNQSQKFNQEMKKYVYSIFSATAILSYYNDYIFASPMLCWRYIQHRSLLIIQKSEAEEEEDYNALQFFNRLMSKSTVLEQASPLKKRRTERII